MSATWAVALVVLSLFAGVGLFALATLLQIIPVLSGLV